MNENAVIKVKVQLTAKDLWQFSMYHTNRGFLGLFNVLFSVAALYVLLTAWDTLSVPYRLLLLLCILIFTVWQPGILYMKAKKQALTPAVKNPMEMEFREDGITIVQMQQQVDFTWEQIGSVIKKPTMLIFYMDRIHAYLIPKMILGEQEAGLFALLKEKIPGNRRRGI